MNETLLAIWQSTSLLELISVSFGLLYVILAARENVWCWPAALINTATAIFLFWDASLLMESGLNVFYLVIAVYGWWQWRHGGSSRSFNQQSRVIQALGKLANNPGFSIDWPLRPLGHYCVDPRIHGRALRRTSLTASSGTRRSQ